MIGVTVLLILHPKMGPGRVVGSDIAHAAPLTLLAGAGHWYLGSVDWSLLGNYRSDRYRASFWAVTSQPEHVTAWCG